MFALILENKVVDISETKFPVAQPLEWMECENSVRIGWYCIEGVFKETLKTDSEVLSETKEQKIKQIKQSAYNRITTTYSEYKQRNLNGAVSLIQNKELLALKAGSGNYTPTENEMTLLRAAKTCKNFIDAIRTKSNQLEVSLDSMTEEQLNAFDPSEDSNWE